MAAQSLAAQPGEIGGTILYQGGAKIPAAQIRIFLEEPALDKETLGSGTRLQSSGAAKAIAFAFPWSERTATSPTLQIVARLENAATAGCWHAADPKSKPAHPSPSRSSR